jgi:hypothetical protein
MVAITAARRTRPASANTVHRTRRRRAAPSRKSGISASRVERKTGGAGSMTSGRASSTATGRASWTATGRASSTATGTAGGRGGGVTRLGRVAGGNGGGHAFGLAVARWVGSRGGLPADASLRATASGTPRLVNAGDGGAGRGGRGLSSDEKGGRPRLGARASVTLAVRESSGIDGRHSS